MSEQAQGAGARGLTQGPWEATQNRHLQLFVCRSDNHDQEICEITSGKSEDARAIAALPDLIEALEEMRAEFRIADLPYGSRAYLMSGQALAKARGEA